MYKDGGTGWLVQGVFMYTMMQKCVDSNLNNAVCCRGSRSYEVSVEKQTNNSSERECDTTRENAA